MGFTVDNLAACAGVPANANMRSTLAGLERAGVGLGLNRPHRLAHYLAQVAHESGNWKYDQEIWGPTAAQKRYEGRADLGNTQPGDGARFKGRGPIQLTGRYNYSRFTKWARQMDGTAPDFVANPDAVNTDPWEGLSSLWYWSDGNPTGNSLNAFADVNDIETITRRVNGGLNGFDDRKAKYVQIALVLLGYGRSEIRRFQTDAGLTADGIAGPKTMAALHAKLKAAPLIEFGTRPAAGGGVFAALLAALRALFAGRA